MKDIAGKTAVVTGAGSGIGRATALALAGEGAHVAVTDIDEPAARETAEHIRSQAGQASVHVMDVSRPDQVEAVAGQIRETLGVPAILVNNAGIGAGSYFMDTSTSTWERVVAINLMGVVHGCRAFVPAMAAADQPGHVVNIASMLGYTPARGVSAYCATKFGVLGFSECLRAELHDHGIGVSAICPGVVRTNIIGSSVLESSEVDVEQKREEVEALYRRRNFPPEKVAKAIVGAIRRDRAVVPVTAEAWALYYLKRWVPWLVRRMAKKDLVSL
jgi:NAD(P)-dependent dehydrogenase (short-subunit alcohol dehydrogenase family)